MQIKDNYIEQQLYAVGENDVENEEEKELEHLIAANKRQKKKGDPKFDFLMAQIIISMIVVLMLFSVKMIGGNLFQDCKRYYKAFFGDKTSISQVVDANAKVKVKAVNAGVGGDDYEANIPYFENYEEASEAIEESKEDGDINSMLVPCAGPISSGFGPRVNPITKKNEIHGGIDIAAAYNTEIKVALSGTVKTVGKATGYGNYIVVSHNNGLETLYGHCNKIIAKEGQPVKKGDTIALVGSTGLSTGPHCHFEIRLNGTRLNPSWIL
ncbi:MAG: hypothetical protein BGN88_12205 [Clostridiales bacterium 43-6]|nr:MAG: hypothetical protein BGN88_12205 [Clostridiales bacterium 43-6]